jgi:hypothetical protein
VRRGGVAACIGIAIAALAPATARASPPFGLGSCADLQGVHQCSGLVSTWDGVPLDTTVTLPSAGAARLPLVVLIHGFGNSKYEYLDPASSAYTGNAFEWARDGYAVLTYTARGLWGSCGTAESDESGMSATQPSPVSRPVSLGRQPDRCVVAFRLVVDEVVRARCIRSDLIGARRASRDCCRSEQHDD